MNEEKKMKLEELECIQCNKCTMSCPVNRVDPEFSPRGMILRLLMGEEDSLIHDKNIFRCLTCDACRETCPSHTKFVDFLRQYRHLSRQSDASNDCKHGSLLFSIQKMMADLDHLPQRRLGWEAGLRIDPESPVCYFTGCLPIFDQVFPHTQSTKIARNTLEILNRLNVVPAVFQEEKCCGYDAYWNGNDEVYEKLAAHNISLLRDRKIGRVVTSCPECYNALKFHYPHLDPSFQPEVLHISQWVAQEIQTGRLRFKELHKKVTFHDPCRLGRVAKEYEAPRIILKAIPGLELVEMPRNRENSPCCGVGSYSNCDSHTKFLQNERLKEAISTGALVMGTGCPKCRIHFNCYLDGKPIEELVPPQIEDLTGIILEAMEG